MIRTQVMLPRKLKTQAKKQARQRGVSMGGLIRVFLEEKLAEKARQQNAREVFAEMASLAQFGIDNQITAANFRQKYHELLNK